MAQHDLHGRLGTTCMALHALYDICGIAYTVRHARHGMHVAACTAQHARHGMGGIAEDERSTIRPELLSKYSRSCMVLKI